jgi:hypothetical protein
MAAIMYGAEAIGHVLPITEPHGAQRAGFMRGPAGATTKVDGARMNYMDRRLRRVRTTGLQATRTDITRITTTMEKATDITAMMISLLD